MTKIAASAFAIVLAACLGGCIQPPPPTVPVSGAQYDAVMKADPQRYSPQIVLLHNLRRVMDADLPAGQRVESLQLVIRLGSETAEVRAQLASVLSDPKTPPEVHQAILTFLLQKDYPDLAGHVVAAMTNLTKYSTLHDLILDWLSKHPTSEVLAELVKLWSLEDPNGPNEPRYRQVVEKIAAAQWDQAMFDAMNTPGFGAPGAAMAVLVKRMAPVDLRQRLDEMPPRTEAVSAVQVFQRQFDYLPTTQGEFDALVQYYQQDKPLIHDASRLSMQWRDESNYVFNARDFHLVSRLAQDPLRTSLKRSQLVAELTSQLNARKHTKSSAGGDDRFWTKAETLSNADLWNLYLLADLLARPRTQMAIWVLSEGDRDDRNGAWGGLVSYRAGQAEATKYPAQQQIVMDDLTFVPAPTGRRNGGEYDFAADQRESLCRFICHFEKPDNAARSGPTAGELKDAKSGNYYGLVLTSLSEDTFCAHYFNPQGVVVSLGTYTMKKPAKGG